MKLALLSDIHANLHALEAVIQDVEGQNVDRVYNLGDVVGYNAFPAECTDLIKKRATASILGNHDWAATVGTPAGFNYAAREAVDYSRRQLKPHHVDFLASLKPHMGLDFAGVKVDLYHGSPSDPLWHYVFPSAAPPVYESLMKDSPDDAPRVVALGHTHVPMLFTSHALEDKDVGELRSSSPETGLAKDRKHPLVLFNPGSVGQPRDGDPRAAYALLETDPLRVTFRRVEYDWGAAARAVREASLPGVLGDRLALGR